MLERLVLENLRIITIPYSKKEIDDHHMQLAMTINEELKQVGYTLKTNDILKLARLSEKDMKKVHQQVLDQLVLSIDTPPMYPDFPTYVLNLDESIIRFHQLVHYFTTYGIEAITNTPVSKGWLPEVDSTSKDVSDTSLLEAKVIDVIYDDDLVNYCFNKILTKRERMSLNDSKIIECLISTYPDAISMIKDIEIPFKENMLSLANSVFKQWDQNIINKEDSYMILNHIAIHTGDVFRIVDYVLGKYHYKFSTKHKKFFVQLLESYSISDFMDNIYPSNKKVKRILILLNFLDYNKYSRSTPHKEAVYMLRNNKLQSYEGKFKSYLNTDIKQALSMIQTRPGLLLRSMTLLLNHGVDANTIYSMLVSNVSKLSKQTLLKTLIMFSNPECYSFLGKQKYNVECLDILKKLFKESLKTLDLCIKNKKVYVDDSLYDLSHSYISFTKDNDDTYIKCGIAYRIPKDVKCIRFFTYWNDEHRIDIDLHADAFYYNIPNALRHVGYYSSYNTDGMVHSGDITHSDAAEYIDIDLNRCDYDRVKVNINCFSGCPFNEIDTCFTGLLAVDKLKTDVKLYNVENCIFSHHLNSNKIDLDYGFIDIKNRYIMLSENKLIPFHFNNDIHYCIDDYLKDLFAALNVTTCSKEEADYIIGLDKQDISNYISLIDHNYFLDN